MLFKEFGNPTNISNGFKSTTPFDKPKNKFKAFNMDNFTIKLYLQSSYVDQSLCEFLHITAKNQKDSNKFQKIISNTTFSYEISSHCKTTEEFFDLLVDAFEKKDFGINLSITPDAKLNYTCNVKIGFQCIRFAFGIQLDKYLPFSPRISAPQKPLVPETAQGRDIFDLKVKTSKQGELITALNSKFNQLETQYSILLKTVSDQGKEILQLENLPRLLENKRTLISKDQNTQGNFGRAAGEEIAHSGEGLPLNSGKTPKEEVSRTSENTEARSHVGVSAFGDYDLSGNSLISPNQASSGLFGNTKSFPIFGIHGTNDTFGPRSLA